MLELCTLDTKLGVIWMYLSQWHRWGNLDANLGGYFNKYFILLHHCKVGARTELAVCRRNDCQRGRDDVSQINSS
jgi:hypothetical protein